MPASPILAALLLVVPSRVPPTAMSLGAPRWKDIGRTPSGNVVSIDPATVKHTGPLVAATVRVVFTPPVRMPRGMLTSSRTAAVFDCGKRAVAVRENVLYGDARGATVLERHVNKLPGYGPALAGSPVEIALTYLCRK